MPRGAAPGERRGGRQKGTPNKATVARQNAQAESLAQATAAVMAGIDLSKFEGITGLAVMRLAMMAHLQANDLQAAAQWGEKVAPYETPKPIARDPERADDQPALRIIGGLPDDRDNPPDVPPEAGADIPGSGTV